jgi:hypothetical protein
MAESTMLDKQVLAGADEFRRKSRARLNGCRGRLWCLGEGERCSQQQRDGTTRKVA